MELNKLIRLQLLIHKFGLIKQEDDNEKSTLQVRRDSALLYHNVVGASLTILV